jgi:hypothetical protein
MAPPTARHDDTSFTNVRNSATRHSTVRMSTMLFNHGGGAQRDLRRLQRACPPPPLQRADAAHEQGECGAAYHAARARVLLAARLVCCVRALSPESALTRAPGRLSEVQRVHMCAHMCSCGDERALTHTRAPSDVCVYACRRRRRQGRRCCGGRRARRASPAASIACSEHLYTCACVDQSALWTEYILCAGWDAASERAARPRLKSAAEASTASWPMQCAPSQAHTHTHAHLSQGHSPGEGDGV